jgi:hypothetical protein
MAFNLSLLSKLQPNSPFIQDARIPYIKANAFPPQFWMYNAFAGGDASAAVEASGYFYTFANWESNNLFFKDGQYFQAGDIIYCQCTDINVYLQVTAINPVTTLPISWQTGNVAAYDSLMVYLKVPMTLANFTGMYAAPFLLINAPTGTGPTGTAIIIDEMVINWVYGSAALTGGGPVLAQYGNTANGLGAPATGTLAAADFTGIAASTSYAAVSPAGAEANSTIVDLGIYLSNQTAPFATGTGGSAIVHLWFHYVYL